MEIQKPEHKNDTQGSKIKSQEEEDSEIEIFDFEELEVPTNHSTTSQIKEIPDKVLERQLNIRQSSEIKDQTYQISGKVSEATSVNGNLNNNKKELTSQKPLHQDLTQEIKEMHDKVSHVVINQDSNVKDQACQPTVKQIFEENTIVSSEVSQQIYDKVSEINLKDKQQIKDGVFHSIEEHVSEAKKQISSESENLIIRTKEISDKASELEADVNQVSEVKEQVYQFIRKQVSEKNSSISSDEDGHSDIIEQHETVLQKPKHKEGTIASQQNYEPKEQVSEVIIGQSVSAQLSLADTLVSSEDGDENLNIREHKVPHITNSSNSFIDRQDVEKINDKISKKHTEFQQTLEVKDQVSQTTDEEVSTKHTPISSKNGNLNIEEQELVSQQRIEEVHIKISELHEEVKLFKGQFNDDRYQYLEEMLIRHMIHLDDIDVLENTEIRNYRKCVIQLAQIALSELELGATMNNREEGKLNTKKLIHWMFDKCSYIYKKVSLSSGNYLIAATAFIIFYFRYKVFPKDVKQ